ncbi:MAG TPA: carboxylesterase family protein [Candidatus Acidoferrales bacterium]|nr:carboxylesterase family protein [Candidatus Acidoferrales bacterium]
MKLSRIVCSMTGLALVAILAAVGPAAAQFARVYPNPLNAKAPTSMKVLKRSKVHHKASAINDKDAIVTEGGPLKGLDVWGGDGYFGIPYAAPPVGNLRWMPPQPPPKFRGVFQANSYGGFCTQPDGAGGAFGSEDCLTLDILRPHQKKNANTGLPVMVWFHGGGLVTGNSFFYKPVPLVLGGNVIEVNVNYRLGYLGFFAHPAIDAEGHANGNYGLMDQQAALQWVHRNIAAFGGDPNRVTIFGESAGGQSIYCHLASPTAAGLFERAISESGAGVEFQDYWDFIVPVSQGESLGTSLVPSGTSIAASAGCATQTASCLRGLPVETLASMEPANVFPFVDGTILTQTPTDAFTNGQFNRVPVISGGNHDEERIFVARQYDFAGSPLVTMSDYDNALLAFWGAGFDPFVLALYPFAGYPSAGVALAASETDGIFACPARNAARLLSQYVTTYAYEFNDENAPDLFDPVPTFPLGAYHSAEIPYLFDLDVRFAGFNPFMPDQQALSNTMIGYWTQFATTGDPNFAGAPTWLPYDSGTDQFQSLVPPAPMAESTFDSDHQCSSFWSAF